METVLDASVLSEYLIGSTVGGSVRDYLLAREGGLHLPHIAVVETAAVLRAWVARGEVTAARAVDALVRLAEVPARRWPVEPVLARVWELRANVSVYDASYVALAERLGAELVTVDRRLARAVAALGSCDVWVPGS